jgi:hypothetical protein
VIPLTLKDYFQSDLNAMFSTDEFGETHNINGADMVIIPDNDLLQERDRKNPDPGGIYLGKMLILVSAAEYAKCGGARPTPGEELELDNKTYRVVDCPRDEDMYSITLEAWQP